MKYGSDTKAIGKGQLVYTFCVLRRWLVPRKLLTIFVALEELGNILYDRKRYSDVEATLIQAVEARNQCEPVDESSLVESK